MRGATVGWWTMSQELLTEPVAAIARSEPAGCVQTRSRSLRVLAPALVSALLLWLCYFPVNAGWLGWVALIPLLTLVRSQARARTVYFSAWFAGVAFFLPALQWLRVADERMVATWIALVIWCSLFVVAAV